MLKRYPLKGLKEIVLGLAIFVACTLFFITSSAVPSPSGAQSGLPNLSGWAWSDNIGWICVGDSQCSSANVEFQPNGDLLGFGWSDNIGWVKFGNLSGFPSGSGTTNANAKYNLATKTITGWARACAGTVGGDCTSMTSRSDGWDGWISLSGTGYGLKVDTDNTNLISSSGSGDPYAWGSDVVGWVNFKDVIVEGLSNDCSYNFEGQDYVVTNNTTRDFYTSCSSGQRTRTSVACVDGVATAGSAVQESCTAPGADCQLPAPAGATPVMLSLDAEPVTRYSRSQVRAGESCEAYKTRLDCVSQGTGDDATSVIVTIPPGGNASSYLYENCRALPSVIER